jgi:integrase/recombinase XerC/integrase/recombinase XerD
MSALNRDTLLILKPAPLTADLTTFYVAKEAQGVSKSYLTMLRTELSRFRDYLADAGITSVLDVKPSHVRAYLLSVSEHRNAGGLHIVFRCIKTFLRWYADELDAPQVAAMVGKVKPPKLPDEPLEPVSLDVVRALIAVCGKDAAGLRDKAIMLTMLDTGIRVSELCGLDMGDVNLSNGMTIIRKGKGSKSRTVVIGAKARRDLLRYLRVRGDAPGALFLTVAGGRLCRHAITSMLRRRAKAADVPPPGPHDFRRAFALLSLRAGCDILSLQRLMGHANLTILHRYVKLTQDDLAAAHARTSPVDRL